MRARSSSWAAIAEECGYPSPDAARVDVNRAYQERLAEFAEGSEELRQVELDHLDELRQKVWDVLSAEHITVSHGRVVHLEDEQGNKLTVPDYDPILRAVDRLVRISEARRRLLGLDSAVKVDAGVTVRYEVVGVDPAALT